MGNPSYIYFSWAINWGVVYSLPNETWIINQQNRRVPPPKPVLERRHRRDLYGRLEKAIDKYEINLITIFVFSNNLFPFQSMGYNGRECILRALCESPKMFQRKAANMVEELVRTIFRMPSGKVLPYEPVDLLAYDSAHRRGRRSLTHCPSAYPACGMSLIDMAMGAYSKPFM